MDSSLIMRLFLSGRKLVAFVRGNGGGQFGYLAPRARIAKVSS